MRRTTDCRHLHTAHLGETEGDEVDAVEGEEEEEAEPEPWPDRKVR